MIKRVTLIFAVILITFSCRKKTIDCDHERESWKAIDIPVDSNCNFYAMYFLTGEYMFRIASSGKCQSLTRENYIEKYQYLLKEHGNEIPIQSGKIIFEGYRFEPDSIFEEKLIGITNDYFKTKSKVVEKEQGVLVIKTYK